MIGDLNLPIVFNMVPTVRDKDGLALSSRNVFLNNQERAQALNLYQSLLLAKKLIKDGNKNVEFIKDIIKDYLQKFKLIRLDYIDICDADDLSLVKIIKNKTVILITAYVGKTRLIDNILI
jgi:pantoate--beta-alanine ligase